MKQGAILTKVIFLMLLLAVLAYAVSAAVSIMRHAVTTVAAIAYEVGDGFQATGFVVRDEQVLSAPSGINVLLCDEGARVAKDQPLASTFADAGAQEAQLRIDAITQELARYEAVLGTVSSAQGNSTLGEQLQQELLHFTAQTARGDLTSTTATSNRLKTLVLHRFLDDSGRAAMQTQAQSLREELAALRARLSGAVTQSTAKQAGFFSGNADGYESVLTPQRILSMTPQEFDAVAQLSPDPPTAIGRLITSPAWYFVCAAQQKDLENFSVGTKLKVDFSSDIYDTLTMQVEHISAPADGRQVLVLSCYNHMSEAACLRTQSADITLHSYAGLRIPKQALRYHNDSGTAGVYILEGSRARWKPVEIIYETTDYFLIRQDKTNTGHLWVGDEVIITAKELTDGEVID